MIMITSHENILIFKKMALQIAFTAAKAKMQQESMHLLTLVRSLCASLETDINKAYINTDIKIIPNDLP